MRTDIHKPSAIVPADYEFVGFDYLGPDPDVWTDRKEIHAHQKLTGADYSTHEHGGSCMVCGASAYYVGVFFHAKSNTYVEIGEDCADKMEVSAGNWNQFRKTVRSNIEAHAGRRKANAYLIEKNLTQAWDIYVADYGTLPLDMTRKSYNHESGEVEMGATFKEEITVRDIVGKLVKWGSISEAAEGYLVKLLARIAERPTVMAARAAEKEAAADCPTGRVLVTGMILKTEEREGQFGTTTKMTVKATEGFIVWCTVPSGAEAVRGAEIKFTVSLEPSDTDKKFGFGKRPVLFQTKEEKAAAKKAWEEQNAQL